MRAAPPAAGARVTVVVPTWNSARWLPGCLAALGRQSWRDFRVLVVDSASRDGSAAIAAEASVAPAVLALPANRGFAAAANAGWRAARTPYVALLNPDTLPEPVWLEAVVACLDAAGEDTAAVASRMLRMEDPQTIDDAGDLFSWYGSAVKRGHGEPASRYERREEVLSACAGAALYRASALAALGGFDEAFGSYLEDVDLGLRARLLGYRCLYEPAARVLHHGGGSDLPRGAYVRLVTCNRLLLVVKCLPLRLLLRHWKQLTWGQIYLALAYRRPLRSLSGYLRLLARLPHALRQRRRILAGRVLADADLERLLEERLEEPRLFDLARRRWAKNL